MRDDFCAFILTHGRPDKVLTYRTLRRAGYTGKIFIVVDDEDKTRHQYMAEFGEQVLVFSKADIASRFDEADNFGDRRSIFYARNACFDLAKLVGCKYFIQLDDDYHEFQFRVDRNYDQAYFPIRKLDAILSEMLAYYESITESHLGKELLEKVELTEDNASKLEEFSKEWKDANDKWNAMWGVKIEQTEDGRHYVAGLGLSMEDTEEGKLSQFLVAANRIAFIDPANGNETPMFVAQGNQIFMNEVFLKYLTAPTITSGGNPPVFSLTPDGRLTAKNADISGNVNANSGTLNNVTINENCRVLGKLSANQIEGDLVKTVGKAFPRDSRAPERWPSGTITVRVYDDQSFDRQIVIPAVAFCGVFRPILICQAVMT